MLVNSKILYHTFGAKVKCFYTHLVVRGFAVSRQQSAVREMVSSQENSVNLMVGTRYLQIIFGCVTINST